jgi:hypothetical protein
MPEGEARAEGDPERMKAVAKLKRRSGYVEPAREGEWPSNLGCALRTQSAPACANTQGVAPGMEVLMGAHRIAATIAAGVLAVGLGACDAAGPLYRGSPFR